MTGYFSLIFSRFLPLLSWRCCLFSTTPARSTEASAAPSYCHPFRCSVHCGRHRMQLTNRNCGHISRERAPCTLWAHTHPQTHTPIQFADCGRLLVQLSASDDNKQRHQFGLLCPALPCPGWLDSSAPAVHISRKLARLAVAPHHRQKLMWHLLHTHICAATFGLLPATCQVEEAPRKMKKLCGSGLPTVQLTAVDIYL